MNGTRTGRTLWPALLVLALTAGLLLQAAGCPRDRVIDGDVTLDELRVAAGTTTTVNNDAIVTVTGDAVIDGDVVAGGGTLNLRVGGELRLNGRIESLSGQPAAAPTLPFSQQTTGLYVVASSVTMSSSAELRSDGPTVITDDPGTLDRTPADLFAEAESASGDLPTLVPLPADDPIFGQPVAHVEEPLPPPGRPSPDAYGRGLSLAAPAWAQPPPPFTLAGRWDFSGRPGDQPIVVTLFTGQRDLELDDLEITSPAGVDGDADDNSADPDDEGRDARGDDGKNGMRLSITNTGGAIRVVSPVVVNLADGGNGGPATAVCASATGGNGGRSGNFRMISSVAIDLTRGTLTINPGRGGNGGAATVSKGAPGANGCPGQDGRNATATGGKGADETKRLFARGNVSGLENVTIRAIVAGDGGNATAKACDGGNGNPCCDGNGCCAGGGGDGGDGGNATATGGKGGEAALDASGLPVTTDTINGGNGGNATATGGNGGNGGKCLLGAGGDGGDGGPATATSGDGGTASGDGRTFGGDSGDATAEGGNGGNGGASLINPGNGGMGGTGSATAGAAGTADTPGNVGNENEADGADGRQTPVLILCINLRAAVAVLAAGGDQPQPGSAIADLVDRDTGELLGKVPVELHSVTGASYTWDAERELLGIGGGRLEIAVDQIELESGAAANVLGVEFATLYAEGLGKETPVVIEALSVDGEVLASQAFPELPDNRHQPDDPFTSRTTFDRAGKVDRIAIVVPKDVFVVFFPIYLIDP